MKKTFIRFHLPVLVYAGLIFLGSSLTSIPTTFPFSIKDKFMHMAEYLVLGILLMRSVAILTRNPWRTTVFFWVMLVGALYGASDEIHQYYVPGRNCDIFDWLADVLGLACGAAIIYIMYARKSVAGDH